MKRYVLFFFLYAMMLFSFAQRTVMINDNFVNRSKFMIFP